jgi:TctA family transporter
VSSVVTCLDGYQMARKGQAGKALGVAALGSFFAGSVATLLIAAFAPPLAELALKFGPADYFSLMVLGLIAAVVLAHGSLIKAIAMIILGLLMGLIGTDVNSGVARYSFGLPELIDGIGIGTVAMGMFGFSEIIRNLEQGDAEREVFTKSITGLWPNWQDIKQSAMPAIRGTVLGSMLGVLPGGGRCSDPFPPTRSRRSSPRTRRASARARSKALPRPSRRTTPRRRLPSFRSSRWAFRRTR